MTDKTVAIFGTGKAKPPDAAFELAFGLGKSLAQAGYRIANGGYGGTMLAAAKGATQANGQVVGVTCRAFGDNPPNEYITAEISTESVMERLNKLIELGQAYVILPGGTGTLVELAVTWELQNKGFVSQAKPIILIGEFWKPLTGLIGSADPHSSDWLHFANGPEEVTDILNRELRD